MKKLTLFFLFIGIVSFAQELKLLKATQQTIHHEAVPASTTNYRVTIKKEIFFKWSIDSVINVYTQKPIGFHIVKVDDPDAVSPNYKQVSSFVKRDKGVFQITFMSSKQREIKKNTEFMDIKVPVEDFTQGAIIYYTVNRKKKQLIIEYFEELQTINAP